MCTGTYRRVSPEELMFNRVFRKIRKDMIDKEGYELKVYRDSLGFPTVGIGHLVRDEDNLKVGDKITTAQAEEFFKDDISEAIWAAIEQAEEIGEFEEDFVMALTHVNFQLGVHWYKKWPNTYAALKKGDFQKAIDNIMKSLWNRQTPKRTKAFKMALLREIAENDRKVIS
jgi:GH24 family phage-related lysozyme (muramidase)